VQHAGTAGRVLEVGHSAVDAVAATSHFLLQPLCQLKPARSLSIVVTMGGSLASWQVHPWQKSNGPNANADLIFHGFSAIFLLSAVFSSFFDHFCWDGSSLFNFRTRRKETSSANMIAFQDCLGRALTTQTVLLQTINTGGGCWKWTVACC